MHSHFLIGKEHRAWIRRRSSLSIYASRFTLQYEQFNSSLNISVINNSDQGTQVCVQLLCLCVCVRKKERLRLLLIRNDYTTTKSYTKLCSAVIQN